MKIIVDAMGGDNAPGALISGAAMAAVDFDVTVVLVGRGEEILLSMKELGLEDIPTGVEIANATEVVDMHDDPGAVIRAKKDSSLVVGMNMLHNGEGEAFLSAGSTGAILAGATLLVKRIRGVRRAALAPVLPCADGHRIIVDSGANTDCTPEYLLQFAYMGAAYAKHVLGKPNPAVGLLNIGTEDTKGMQLQRDSYVLLKDAHSAGKLNFIGNVEARDVFFGELDVIVCDGFSGNILLKSMEGMAMYLVRQLKEVYARNFKTKLGGFLVKKHIHAMKKAMDYTEVGGGVLLGVQKPVLKAHGSSDAKAIRNAIGQAVKMAGSDFVKEIETHIAAGE
jgi:glycerol-3-phosphate acyltransferase PlsX